jgi:hypothetical protein
LLVSQSSRPSAKVALTFIGFSTLLSCALFSFSFLFFPRTHTRIKTRLHQFLLFLFLDTFFVKISVRDIDKRERRFFLYQKRKKKH